VYWSTGYDFNLNTLGTLVLKPSVMLRYVNGAPTAFDFNTMLQIQKYLEVGGSYRTTNPSALAGILNVTLSKRLVVGYAYEVASDIQGSGNTNEFLLKFKF
jgi:hypothetical protein